MSLSPQFSKILEKIFNNRLDNFIESCNILKNGQYGFRSNRSTALALIDLVENLTKELDNKKITVGVFIDLKKAFDTIDHSLLLKKLEYHGIRGAPLNWLKFYLDHRKQYLHFNGTNSCL